MTTLNYTDVKVGDIITFGSYEQRTSSNGAEGIEWQVLDVKDGKALIISCYCLDAMSYNDERTNTTWETSTIRAWLNDKFYSTTFTDEERTLIQDTENDATVNPEYGTDCGKDTCDKVFLLSADEVYYYFKDSEARRAEATPHAMEKGAFVNSLNGGSCWWTRTVGRDRLTTAYVYGYGSVNTNGSDIGDATYTVRPALYIHAKSSADAFSAVEPTWSTGTTYTIGDYANAKVGDTIVLGSYEQDGNTINGAEPIEWIVLHVEDKRELVVSRYVLEPMAVNALGQGSRENVTWETCTMRRWLNGKFYGTAFTEEERTLIQETLIPNYSNPEFGTDCGPNTLDNVFILSVDEVELYFPNNESRKVKPTRHAMNNGSFVYPGDRLDGLTEAWTRTFGQTGLTSAFTYNHGGFELNGYNNADAATGCRPALYITL